MGKDQSLTSSVSAAAALAERRLTPLSSWQPSCELFQPDDRGVAARRIVVPTGFSSRLCPAGEMLSSRQV